LLHKYSVRTYTTVMGLRGPKPKQTIDTTWRPELAYVVGLLASDGCLSSDGRHIDLTSKDREQVATFQQILGIGHVMIGRKTSGSSEGEKKYFRVQFGNVVFCEWLVSIGLSPNKSKTIANIDVPDEYFFDFFRGLFDGDGSVYAFWDTRWKSSYVYCLMITSASPVFMLWLQYQCEKLVDVHGVIRDSVRAQELRFGKKATQTLVNEMYHAKNVPCLKRKFAKLQKIFTIDGIEMPRW
jgi:hypothetical protein